jgi:hypothetical protein
MTLKKALLYAAITFVLLVLVFFAFSSRHPDKTAHAVLSTTSWQHMVLPGELSQPHAFLANNCAACHTPNKGVEAQNCIVCHADNKSVLARQPSAFHADIAACSACHLEHQGRIPSTTKMDHAALARIGLKQVQKSATAHDPQLAALVAWMNQTDAAPHAPQLQRAESQLNCATCHQTKDRHRGLFGNDCAQCHDTTKWTIADYRHPSSASQSCAQCHQAPPSHYMMHFKMISMTVAHMEKAEVNQCFLCHQTTSWNDIKGVGFYKHH